MSSSPYGNSTWELSRTDFVIIEEYREIEEILRRDRDFSAHGSRGEEAIEFIHGTLLDLDGEAHLARRHLFAKIMSPPQVEAYCVRAAGHLESELAKLRGLAPTSPDSVSFDLVEVLRTVLWTLGSHIAGIDYEVVPDGLAQLQALLPRFGGALSVIYSDSDHEELLSQSRAAVDEFRTVFFEPSKARRQASGNGAVHADKSSSHTTSSPSGDLLSRLLDTIGDQDDSDDAIMRECLVLLNGAASNTLNVVCHGLAELEPWLAERSDRAQLIADNEFLSNAAKETIRLHRTGAPYLLRRAVADVQLITSGRIIPRGAQVALDLRAAHRGQDIFGPTAGVFDPYRRLDTSARAKVYGLGFGTGPHVCVAKQLIINDAANSPRLVGTILRVVFAAEVAQDPVKCAARAPNGEARFLTFPVIMPRIAT
jgi:cytochrome P450